MCLHGVPGHKERRIFDGVMSCQRGKILKSEVKKSASKPYVSLVKISRPSIFHQHQTMIAEFPCPSTTISHLPKVDLISVVPLLDSILRLFLMSTLVNLTMRNEGWAIFHESFYIQDCFQRVDSVKSEKLRELYYS